MTGLALQTDKKVLAGGGAGDSSTLARLIGGNNCVVPALRGKTVPKADAELKASYCLRGSIAKRFSSAVRRGRVISSVPVRAARLPGGTKVDLVVSKGKRP
jgi:eukaryotic-like serine/threonine-protein kinase